jgi:hypothetical protein
MLLLLLLLNFLSICAYNNMLASVFCEERVAGSEERMAGSGWPTAGCGLSGTIGN